MKIFVDKLPSSPNTCPFSIKAQLYVNDSIYAPNCKLMIDAANGWEQMTFSATQNRYNCMFHFGKPCSFLKELVGDK
jgi:hypothetical protein